MLIGIRFLDVSTIASLSEGVVGMLEPRSLCKDVLLYRDVRRCLAQDVHHCQLLRFSIQLGLMCIRVPHSSTDFLCFFLRVSDFSRVMTATDCDQSSELEKRCAGTLKKRPTAHGDELASL